jgi:DNA-binding XRE family transcriptional regulator
MEEIAARLTFAREKLGIERAEAAAAFGMAYSTYAAHENGTTGFKTQEAVKYCRKFKMSLDWLILGRGKGPGETDELLDELLDFWAKLTPEQKENVHNTARIFARGKDAA